MPRIKGKENPRVKKCHPEFTLHFGDLQLSQASSGLFIVLYVMYLIFFAGERF